MNHDTKNSQHLRNSLNTAAVKSVAAEEKITSRLSSVVIERFVPGLHQDSGCSLFNDEHVSKATESAHCSC